MIEEYQIYPSFEKIESARKEALNKEKRTWVIETFVYDTLNAQKTLESFFAAAGLKTPSSWNMVIDSITSEKIEKSYDSLYLNLITDQNSAYFIVFRLLKIFGELDDYYEDKEFFIFVNSV